MKNLLWACLSAWLLSGCIGIIWPGPGLPHPGKPEAPDWLLTKVTQRIRNSLGQVSVTKQVHEYLYNGQNKLVVHKYYNNPADSNNLQLTEVDSLFYDSKYRVIQVNHYSSIQNRLLSLRKFMYKNNDRIPYRMEIHSIYDAQGNSHAYPVFVYDQEYTYTDTLVRVVETGGPHTYSDTSLQYYDAAGNLRYGENLSHTPGTERKPYELSGYVNAPNPERYFNLDHGLVFRIDEVKAAFRYYVPKLSKQTWTRYVRNTSTQQDSTYIVRTVTLNGDGLVAQTISPYLDYGHSPYNGYVWFDYEYMKVERP